MVARRGKKGFADSLLQTLTPSFPFRFFFALSLMSSSLFFFSLSLGLNTSHTLYFKNQEAPLSTASHHSHPCKLRALSRRVKYAWQHISAHWCVCFFSFFFFFFCPGHILCRLQYHPLTPIKTKKKRRPPTLFFCLSFTSLAPLEDNRMEAVISAVWPFAFIGAY